MGVRARWVGVVLGVAMLAGGVSAAAERPMLGAFYYGWYPSHWREGLSWPASRYTPLLGLYTSSDELILEIHATLIARAGIDFTPVSYWGPGAKLYLLDLLDTWHRHGLKACLYYEREGYSDPSGEEIAADLVGVYDVFRHPAYLWRDGAPVVMVYGHAETCSLLSRWLAAEIRLTPLPLHVCPKVFAGYANCLPQPESWHQYGVGRGGVDVQKGQSVTIAPGFWRYDEAAPRLERDEDRLTLTLEAALRMPVKWVLLVSWNEWLEGTGIEPYLEEQRDLGQWGASLRAVERATKAMRESP